MARARRGGGVWQATVRILAGGALLLVTAADGAVHPVGDEFRVTTTTGGRRPDVAANPVNGELVVVWEESGQADVFARRYTAAGTPLGAEFRVSDSVSTDYDFRPRVAFAPTGAIGIVWQAEESGSASVRIYARWYDASGNPVTPPLAITDVANGEPAVAVDGLGRFVIAWAKFGEGGIYRQLFADDGTPLGSPLRVDDGVGFAAFPDVAGVTDGRSVVVWSELQTFESPWEVRGRTFAIDGTPAGGEIAVSEELDLSQTGAQISAADDGSFVVAWNRQQQPSFPVADAYVRRFDAAGVPRGPAFSASLTTESDQANPDVAVDADGDFVVVWDTWGPGEEHRDVRGQRFFASGARDGGDFLVSQAPGIQQTDAAVAAAPSGNFLVVWQPVTEERGFDVYARRYVVGRKAKPRDFDGDGDTDVSIFRSPTGGWLVDHDGNGVADISLVYGRDGDVPVPRDFDGDGVVDFAVFRRTSATNARWFVDVNRNGGTDLSAYLGTGNDVPVPADYDGDRIADFAVFQPASGRWLVDLDRNGSADISQVYGRSGDVPVPADYDGDGIDDLAVYRPSYGGWFVDLDGNGSTDFRRTFGGASSDVPVPADYDGNGTADLGVFRAATGEWFVATQLIPGGDFTVTYGRNGDVPVPGDFDGDGRTDLAVYRPSYGGWFIDTNRNGGTDRRATFGGQAGDVPLR